MSGSSVQVDSTSISTMLLALMVICIVVYGYIEFKRFILVSMQWKNLHHEL